MDDSPISLLPREIRDLIYVELGGCQDKFSLVLGRHPFEEKDLSKTAIIAGTPRVAALLVCHVFAREYREALRPACLLELAPASRDGNDNLQMPIRTPEGLRHVLKLITRIEISVSDWEKTYAWPRASSRVVKRLDFYMPALRDVRYDYHLEWLFPPSLLGRTRRDRSIRLPHLPQTAERAYESKGRLFYSTWLFTPAFEKLGADEDVDVCDTCERKRQQDALTRILLDVELRHDQINRICYRLSPSEDPNAWEGFDVSTAWAGTFRLGEAIAKVRGRCNGKCGDVKGELCKV